MKKYIILLLFISSFQVFAQTNIAVPSYASVSNSFNASTGNIKFYLNGLSQTLSVGRGANAVCFYGSDMFVAIDDGIGTKGIIWYANVSFTSGSFTSDAAVILANSQGTFSVAADASGNIYSANNNGTVTKFIRNNIAPFYSAANVVNTIFWANGGFAEASGVFVDTVTQTLWAVSYANNQGAVVKLSDFDYADGLGNNGKIKRFADNNLPNTLLQKPEGIAKDANGNIWIANNNNNYVLRLNNPVVTSFINDLNAEDYSFVTLNTTQLNDFAVSANGNQLGGLVYDNLYSSKMYVNDQQSGGNTFVYSFIANNSIPTFSATAMTQIYPGAGQCAIIPCALLPTPNNPIASGATINSGQTTTLTASGCTADQTYLWQQAGNSVGTNASYTTPTLNSSTTYTAHCVRGGTCQSSGLSVSVTVNSGNMGVTNTGNISVTSALQTNNPRSRTFTFRLPSANVDCNRPLLIALHGDGGNGNGMMSSTGFNAIADAQNFISVYPDAQTTIWGVQWNKYADNVAGYAGIPDPNAADDVQFIADLIDYFYTNYGIDRNKVYVTGHSGGGFMAYSLAVANQTKSKIAGIAPVAANLWGESNYLNTQFGAGVYAPSAVLHIHSTTDNVVDFPTLGAWTWPLASFGYANCNNSAYTTTTNAILEIDTHTFCGTGNQVVLKGLKKAGLGHAWPTIANANYNASQEIWDFLKNYSKGSNPSLILNPAVSPQNVSISSGQTTSLTASACPINTTYLWKQGSTVVSTNSVFTTPTLSTTTIYTAFCIAGNCQSIGTEVTVTVNSAAPCPSTQYVDGLVTPGPFVANQLISASEYIIAGNGIDPLTITSGNSNNLTLRAGKSITINPGMMVGNGAVFKAEIGACDNNPPAHTTFYMEGRDLKDPCGNTVILKGVNKMHVWTDQNGASIAQIAQTGANTVRIVWTITYDHDGQQGTPQIATDDSKLDALIALCIQYKMIPMPEIHDATGNIAALPSVVNYWKRPEMLVIINKYKHAMLLNIANEPGNENVTAQQYEDAYKLAITELRNAGITVPLVIDGAVEYAKDLTPIVQKASILTNHDPLHSLLFSVHPYWPMNNGATPAFITAQFEAAVNANVPLILGELSKYGAWAGNGVSVCSAAGQVDYEWMATEAQRLGIGWLAWEWGPGNSGGGDPLCTAMDMTTNNTYATLTGWGLDLATNATYGLITAQKSSYIENGFQNCN